MLSRILWTLALMAVFGYLSWEVREIPPPPIAKPYTTSVAKIYAINHGWPIYHSITSAMANCAVGTEIIVQMDFSSCVNVDVYNDTIKETSKP